MRNDVYSVLSSAAFHVVNSSNC